MSKGQQTTIADVEGALPEEPTTPQWVSDPAQPYQVMRPLTEDEYEALKASIQQHGVSQPVEVDEAGNILDGHNRFAICSELQIVCPIKVVGHLRSDQEKRDYARQINCAKRSPELAEKKRLAAEMLKEDTSRSNRSIGRIVGMSHHTVEAVRRAMESSGQIAQVVDETDATEEETSEPKFPYLEGDGWKLWQKMEALDLLGRIQEANQKVLGEIIQQRDRQPPVILQIIRAAGAFSGRDWLRLNELWGSEDAKQRAVVISRLLGTMPAPDPRLSHLLTAVQEIEEALRMNGKSPDPALAVEAKGRINEFVAKIESEQIRW